jgi:hypothetical protein
VWQKFDLSRAGNDSPVADVCVDEGIHAAPDPKRASAPRAASPRALRVSRNGSKRANLTPHKIEQ